MTAKSDIFKDATDRAPKQSTTVRWISAGDHFVNIFNDRLAWMKDVKHFFVVVSKNILKYVHKIIMQEKGKKENP